MSNGKTKKDSLLQHGAAAEGVNAAIVPTHDELPARLQGRTGEVVREGFENVDKRTDIKFPRLMLCQSTSDEGKEHKDAYIEGLKDGMFFNNMTKEVYGTEVFFIPVHIYKTRVMYNSKVMGSGVRCRSTNFTDGVGDPGGNCLTCKFQAWGEEWKSEDNPKGAPPCGQAWNVPMLLVRNSEVDPSDFCIMSFKSLGIDRGAKQLITLSHIRKGKPSLYDCVFRLYSKLDERDSGDSFQPFVENPTGISPWTTDDQAGIAKFCREGIIEAVKDVRFVHDETIAQTDDAPEPGLAG